MTEYFRPIPCETGRWQLAGGWLRFSQFELLRRNEARPRADHVPEEYIRSSWKRFHHVMFRPLNPEDPNGNLLKRMIADPYVRVTPVRGESDVFACNFTREAFLEGRWNTRTINARGL